MPDTNPAPEGDQTTQPENDAAYRGLQKVLAKRDADLTAATTALEALQAQHAQAAQELATYRERDAAANEEANARQSYEQLRQRFEAPPPVPVGTNPQRTPASWADADAAASFGQRPRTGTSTGWPV